MSSRGSGLSGDPSGELPAPVESVDRALRLLLYLRDRDSISVTEAAAHLGIAGSTAHRLLSTLTRREFTIQDFSRRYRLGNALSIAHPARVTDSMLSAAAQQPLTELQAKVRETVQIMVLRGGNIRFLDGLESEAVLRVKRRVDDEMPAFVSAGGKAILGQLSNQEVEEIYHRGLTTWPTRRVHTMQMLKRMLTQVRRKGYALNVEETEQGVAGVGVSIVGRDARPVGALTIAIPSARFQREHVADYVAALRAAAQCIQEELYGADSAADS